MTELLSTQQCSHASPTGAPCRNKVGLQPSQAHGGAMRCSWHDADRRGAQLQARREAAGNAQPRAVDPADLPVQEIATLDDALALSRWVPIAIATGKLGGREAQAVVSAIREFRMCAADAGSHARLAALEEQIKAARKRGLDV